MAMQLLPFDIQGEIIKRVSHVKSLLRFRSVSKQWKSFIDHNSSKFIIQNHRILVSYRTYDKSYKYVSIADNDDRFLHCHDKFYPIVPMALKYEHSNPYILGSSHGLVCSYDKFMNLIVVWNPSISKFFGIMLHGEYLAVGFGVCPKTMDTKIIKINVDKKVEVFTLSTGAWRSISVNPCLHLESVRFSVKMNLEPVVIDGVIYWIAFDKRYKRFLLLSFDLISEEFRKLDLPDDIQRLGFGNLLLYKHKESLALVVRYYLDCHVWIMKKNGDSNFPFEKPFGISGNYYNTYKIKGFRMNGLPIILQQHNSDDDTYTEYDEALKVFDPCSRRMSDIEMDADVIFDESFRMTSYTESLLMLNQPATIFQ